MSLDSIKEFYQELAKILSTHEEGFTQITEDTGVSRSTLWRWSNETNRSYPDAEKVLRVLAKISGLNKRKELAKYYGGKIEDFINSFCPISSEFGLRILESESPETSISDFYSFVIFSICETKRGATENELVNIVGNIAVKRAEIPKSDINQEIINNYGVISKSRIKDLVRREILFKGDDGRFHTRTNNIAFNINFALKHLPLIIQEITKPEEFSKGNNAIFSYTESIPVETANKIALRTKEFFKECYEEMEKTKCHDGVPFTIINFAERMWFDSLDGSLEREEKL